jgi:transcriptional regulator with XRE-family HTH domain
VVNSLHSEDLILLGKKITQARKKQKLTKVQLAFEMETSEKYIRRIEKGEVNMGVIALFKLSNVLNIHPKELIGFEDASHKQG